MYEIVTTVVFALVVLLSQWIIARYEANRMRDNMAPEIAAVIATVVNNVVEEVESKGSDTRDELKHTQVRLSGVKTAVMEEVDGLYEQIDDLHEYLGLEYVDEGEKLVKTKRK